MKYTEIVILLMKQLQQLEGELASRTTTVTELTKLLQGTDSTITDRLVAMALTELTAHRLVSVRASKEIGGGRYGGAYHGLDLTGQGLRLLESLELQAKAEGKKQPWLWSMVERAATLGQLISLALQAVGRG